MAATQIEKSTLDAQKYGFTQKRELNKEINVKTTNPIENDKIKISPIVTKPINAVIESKKAPPKLCLIEDPDCEACQ